MSTYTYKNDPAYPLSMEMDQAVSKAEEGLNDFYAGLSKREYMATKIMAGMLANSENSVIAERKLAIDAVKAANILIEELNND